MLDIYMYIESDENTLDHRRPYAGGKLYMLDSIASFLSCIYSTQLPRLHKLKVLYYDYTSFVFFFVVISTSS